MSEEELSKELTDEIFNDFDQALDELKRLIGIDTEELLLLGVMIQVGLGMLLLDGVETRIEG